MITGLKSSRHFEICCACTSFNIVLIITLDKRRATLSLLTVSYLVFVLTMDKRRATSSLPTVGYLVFVLTLDKRRATLSLPAVGYLVFVLTLDKRRETLSLPTVATFRIFFYKCFGAIDCKVCRNLLPAIKS